MACEMVSNQCPHHYLQMDEGHLIRLLRHDVVFGVGLLELAHDEKCCFHSGHILPLAFGH